MATQASYVHPSIINVVHIMNNKIKARALNGQSAINYGLLCPLTHGKIDRLLNYYIKAIHHNFPSFVG